MLSGKDIHRTVDKLLITERSVNRLPRRQVISNAKDGKLQIVILFRQQWWRRACGLFRNGKIWNRNIEEFRDGLNRYNRRFCYGQGLGGKLIDAQLDQLHFIPAASVRPAGMHAAFTANFFLCRKKLCGSQPVHTVMEIHHHPAVRRQVNDQ